MEKTYLILSDDRLYIIGARGRAMVSVGPKTSLFDSGNKHSIILTYALDVVMGSVRTWGLSITSLRG